METSSVRGSGILPNINQSLHSGIFQNDLINIATSGIMVDNDTPVVSRTQRYNFGKIQGIQLAGLPGVNPQSRRDNVRGSNASQSVRFAQQLETQAIKSNCQSPRGSQANQTILLNRQPADLTHIMELQKMELQQPRDSQVRIPENNIRLSQTRGHQTYHSNYLQPSQNIIASVVTPPMQINTILSPQIQPIPNLYESAVVPMDINNVLNKTLNESLYNQPLPVLGNVPSLTKPEGSVSERTVLNINQNPSQMLRNSIVQPSLPTPQIIQTKNNQISQSNPGSFARQTIQKQILVNNTNQPNNFNSNQNTIIEKQINEKSIVNSQHSRSETSRTQTQKSIVALHPPLVQNNNNHVRTSRVSRNNQSNVQIDNQNLNISNTIANGMNNILKNSQQSINRNSEIQKHIAHQLINSQILLNQNPNISTVLADATINNLMINSNIFQQQQLEGTRPQPNSNHIDNQLAISAAKSIHQLQRSNAILLNRNSNNPMFQHLHPIIAQTSHINQLGQIDPTPYVATVTPSSPLFHQPIVHLINEPRTSQIPSVIKNRQQIINEAGGIIKTTTIQQIIPSHVTNAHHFARQIKVILGLNQSQGIEEARMMLKNIQIEHINQIQGLRYIIQKSQQQKIAVEGQYFQTLKKFEFNVKVLEQVQAMLNEKQQLEMVLLQQNQQIKQNQAINIQQINRIHQHLSIIVRQRQQSSIRHKSQMQNQLYVKQQLQTQVGCLNANLNDLRTQNIRNRSDFDLRQFQLQQQLKKLQLYEISSSRQASQLRYQIEQLLNQKQILQNQLNNKNVLHQQKDMSIEECRIRINNLNQKITVLLCQKQKLEMFAFEFEKLKTINHQITLEFSRKQENYIRQIEIMRRNILELQRKLTEFEKLQLANRDQVRYIGQMQHLIRQKNNQINMHQTAYHTEIINLKAIIEMRVAQIQNLKMLVDQAPAHFIPQLESLKQQFNILTKSLHQQKLLRISERQNMQKEGLMRLAALKMEYEAKLADQNKMFDDSQRLSETKLLEETNRYNALLADYQKKHQYWQARYNKQSHELNQRIAQLSTVNFNSQLSGNQVQNMKRINADMQLRLREQQMQKKRLTETILILREKQHNFEQLYRSKYQEAQIIRVRMEKQHQEDIVRRNKDFEYQKSVLMAQFQDAQQRINNINSQFRRVSDQLAQQRKKYFEATSVIKTQTVDNPTLVYQLRQKNQYIDIISSELEDVRTKLRISDSQWRVLQNQNRRLCSTLQTQRAQFNSQNYNLKCQISDLLRKIQAKEFNVRMKNTSNSQLPTSTSINCIRSQQIITDNSQAVLTGNVEAQRVTFCDPFPVDKTAVFENRIDQIRTQRIQRISTPSKLQRMRASGVQASPLLTANEAISRCITAETTISASPTSRVIVNLQPPRPFNQSPAKIIHPSINLTPPKIERIPQQTNTRIEKNVNHLAPVQRTKSPQINYNQRLKLHNHQQLPLKKVQMTSTRPLNKIRQNLVQTTKITIHKNVQSGPTTSKLMNTINRSRSRSRSKSPHPRYQRPPLSPQAGLASSKASRVVVGQQVNIPLMTVTPIAPMGVPLAQQYMEPRTLNHVRSTSALSASNKQDTFSATSINNQIVQKQISKQPSLRTSVINNLNVVKESNNMKTSIQSFVSEGDYGMNVLQKQQLDKRNCC